MTMLFEYALAGIAAVGLTVYLLYALIRPERF
jgi:K+-transporting ATPase KdpF subunit